MRIEQLTDGSYDAYVAFRRQMWPLHDAAGHWDVVLHKYFLNPHADLCPGSGLYACREDSGEICGIAGAYPMPVTLDSVLYPGHMLVDWAVLPRYWTGPRYTTSLQGKFIAGKLFASIVSLPGMKFASYGSAYSQLPLERKAKKIPTVVGGAILSPVKAALLELLRLRTYAQPSPLSSLPLVLPGRAETIPADSLPPVAPENPRGTVYVVRDATFWCNYFRSRCYHGASALALQQDRETGHIVFNLLECGRLRFAVLLALHLSTPSISTARRLGVAAREALRALGVSVLIATEADDSIRAFLSSVGKYVVRRAAHWWIIPKSSDSFCAEDVQWWLTSAERDAIWSPSPHTPPDTANPSAPAG